VGAGDDTVWAVVLGAVLATAGGFIATQLDAFFRRRERERFAALLFGELLSVIEVLLVLADEARGRGEPYGPMTMRLMRGAMRETETYDRNRESLYDLRDPALRARIHTMMVRVGLTLEGVFETAAELASLTEGAEPETAARIGTLTEVRNGAFDFAVESVEQIRLIVKELQPLAKQAFADHGTIARNY
jgi:hypothetical protein